MVIADRDCAFWLRHRAEGGPIERFAVPAGVSMLTAGELDDPASPRIRAYLPRFRAAPAPAPGAGDWMAWEALMAARAPGPAAPAEAAMTVVTGAGFETVSSALIALGRERGAARWRFAAGRPDVTPYADLTF